MKKSLLALAVLGAFAGAASAQTNVTIYGIVDAAIERSDTNEDQPTWSLTDANTSYNKNGSRLGFKGSEDLGGGLSAIFALENGFNVDNGTLGQGGRIFGRQAWVGLQGGFGAVKLGRQYTPMHLALDTLDPFGTGMAGNIANLFNNNGVRTDNTINYSLSMAGFSGQVSYSFGEVAGENKHGRQIGLGLGYANGPLNVQFAYHDRQANPTLAATLEAAALALGATAAEAAAIAAPELNDRKTALIGATYDLGVAKLHGAFQNDETELASTGAANGKDRSVMLGVSAPVGAGEVRASFIRSDDRLAASNADISDQVAVGYVHNLSKRTNVYTSFAYLKEEGQRTNGSDLKTNIFNVGIQHKF